MPIQKMTILNLYLRIIYSFLYLFGHLDAKIPVLGWNSLVTLINLMTMDNSMKSKITTKRRGRY